MHPTPAVWHRLRPALTASRRDGNALAERAAPSRRNPTSAQRGRGEPRTDLGTGAMVGTSTLTDRVSATEWTSPSDNPPK
jgi:hypothetical protein